MSKKFYQRGLTIINFLRIFGPRSIKIWKTWPIFSNFNPFPSMPSVAIDDRKQFQYLQIVYINKTRKTPSSFFIKLPNIVTMLLQLLKGKTNTSALSNESLPARAPTSFPGSLILSPQGSVRWETLRTRLPGLVSAIFDSPLIMTNMNYNNTSTKSNNFVRLISP